MSYNTRRNQGYGGVNSRLNVRAGIQQNFVSGGQFNPASVKSSQQQQQHQQRNQQQSIVQQQKLQQQQQQLIPPLTVKQPPVPLPSAPLKSALKKEVKVECSEPRDIPTIIPQQIIPSPISAPTTTTTTTSPDIMTDQNGEDKKKAFFRTTKAGKISRKERRGRRNQRLRKILQPKNPLMVLNELVGGHKFTVLEQDKLATDQFQYMEPDMFLATVIIDGVEHIGYGKNKAAAKSAAAEVALKHLILTKLRNVHNKISSSGSATASTAGSTISTMECDADLTVSSAGEADSETSTSPDEEDISWLPIASFAMYKLFSSWDTDGSSSSSIILDNHNNHHQQQQQQQQQQHIQAAVIAGIGIVNSGGGGGTPIAKRPAKELPQNPQLMNPVMLLNQMKPGTTYEDVAKEGNSPYTVFTVRTIVDGHEFYGKGGNKKLARKNCAYAACTKLFGLIYTADEYQPIEPMIIQ